PAAAPGTLTLAAAIDLALAHNPQLAIEAESIVAAQARANADSKLRLPLLSVRANVLFWDRPIIVDLGMDPNGNETKITVRPRTTGTVDFPVAPPLSGALVIGKLSGRAPAATAASRAQRDGVRIDVAYQTAEAYLGALQAATLGKIAQATLAQLDADL